MPELAVVVPVYNEEGSISDVVKKWTNTLDRMKIDYRMSVYDDGSRDATGKILERLSKSNPRLSVRSKTNSGHGPTILLGYRENSDCAWVFQMDSDDEMGPDSFGLLWHERSKYDILVGKRSGRVNQLPRRVVSLLSRLVVRTFYGPGFWDVNSPYRLMRSEVFRDLYFKIPDDTFAPNILISGFAHRHNVNALETEVPYTERRTGTVSLKKLKILKAAMKSFRQTIAFSFIDRR